jgi:hypothetical protein
MSFGTVQLAEKKLGRYAIRWAGALVALLVLLCFSTPAALGTGCSTLAGTVSTWTDGNSNWNGDGNWNAGVPNSTTSACITNGTSTVTLDANSNSYVEDLELGNGNTLTSGLNIVLLVYGTQMINNGQIMLNGGSG